MLYYHQNGQVEKKQKEFIKQYRIFFTYYSTSEYKAINPKKCKPFKFRKIISQLLCLPFVRIPLCRIAENTGLTWRQKKINELKTNQTIKYKLA